MATNYQELAGATVRRFAAQHRLLIFEVGGQYIFPIYAKSGGLHSSYICYFAKDKWPEGVDLGREKFPALGVIAVEIENGWGDDKVSAHLEEVLRKHGH